jgi:hypothetical protein
MWRWEQVGNWLAEPKLGAELGVKEGKFTAHMLERFPRLHMVAVDLWQAKPPSDQPGFETYAEWNFDQIEAEFCDRIASFRDRVTVCRCDTVRAAGLYDDGAFDFVFIDAEHTHRGVAADIAAWLPKVKAGGILSGHDYQPNFPGVQAAVDDFIARTGKILQIGDNDCWAVRC